MDDQPFFLDERLQRERGLGRLPQTDLDFVGMRQANLDSVFQFIEASFQDQTHRLAI